MANDTAPIDIEGFRSVMREAGIEDIVESTLQVYADESPRMFEALEAAAAASNMSEVSSAAHALKSGSANIWATDLVPLFDGMEDAGREGDEPRVTALLDQARPLFRAVIEYAASV